MIRDADPDPDDRPAFPESCGASPPGSSASVARLATALAAAQAEIRPAARTEANDHFRSRYADLASVWDACRAPLTRNGLSVLQLPRWAEGSLWLRTLLLHASGEWVESEYPVFAEYGNPQKLGSTLTYARRYALMALVGVAPDDDDGDAAARPGRDQGRERGRGPSARPATPPDRPSRLASAPPAAQAPRETWAAWVARVATEANDEWANETKMEGVEPARRKDLVNQWRLANHVCSAMIADQVLSAGEVADPRTGKRDRTRTLAEVSAYYGAYPQWVKRVVLDHLKDLRHRGRAELGLPDPEAEADEARAHQDAAEGPAHEPGQDG